MVWVFGKKTQGWRRRKRKYLGIGHSIEEKVKGFDFYAITKWESKKMNRKFPLILADDKFWINKNT